MRGGNGRIWGEERREVEMRRGNGRRTEGMEGGRDEVRDHEEWGG